MGKRHFLPAVKCGAICVGLGLALGGCSSASNPEPGAPVNVGGAAPSAGAPAAGAGTGGTNDAYGGAPSVAGASNGNSAGAMNAGASATGGTAGAATGGGATGGGATGGVATGGAATAGAATAGAGASAGGAAGNGGTNGSGGATGTGGALPNVSVYIAGDSTVSQYVLDPKDPKSWAGWGQMLGAYYQPSAKVIDDAVGGRTARRFIQEGTLDGILKVIKPGDYLLVQFGTNDSNTTASYVLNGVTYPYYAAAETDFKKYLQEYITGALGKKAIPVLVTPPPRNSAYCNGPRSLANYGQAMIELGTADSVAVVDLGEKTHAYLTVICPKPTTAAQEMFFKINADGSIDGTHFQENGARIMAGFVADGIGEDKLGLAAYRKP